jgi:glutamate-ammonia-ligase adenylyltransferase
MAFAPRLASTLARRPAAIDAMLDGAFFESIDIAEDRSFMETAIRRATPQDQIGAFEAAMDAVRRVHREQAFRVGVQVMSGTASAEIAGKAFADLADLCVSALARAALAETARLGGDFRGDVAVVALGKCGGREMSAGSDLDLMTFYRAAAPSETSSLKGWDAATFYGRFTQRLIAALSSQTAEGGLYEVDMQLRPSGTKGPVAVSQAAFETYYEQDAETWELLALTRARVIWATSDAFAAQAARAIETALRRPRDRNKTAQDVCEMRQLLETERPPKGPWDLKLSPGGLVDIEFAVQFLQLAHAAHGGPLEPNTARAIMALRAAGLAAEGSMDALADGGGLQQDLTQLLKVALSDDPDPAGEPPAFRALLARAGGARDFRQLRARLEAARAAGRKAYDLIVQP